MNNTKKELKKVNKIQLFYIAIVSNIIGCTLVGLGIGKFFSQYWVGILVGLGIGVLITTIILLKTVGRLNGHEINEN